MNKKKSKQSGDHKRREDEVEVQFTWKDILAFCLAMYRLLLPQLLITLLVVLVLVYLLFGVWFN